MEKFDIAVIGGGPAGLFAAGTAAKDGARVVLIEKNPSVGEKLLIAGKGRCNITNAEEDMNTFISRYGDNGKFLYSAFSQFGASDAIDFFNSRGIKTIVERGGRVFPEDGDASLILKCLLSFCKEGRVLINRNTEVKNIVMKGNSIDRLIVKMSGSREHGSQEIEASCYILATGGKSFPKTGSTGDGYIFAARAGHTIITPRPVIVPIKTHETWVKLAKGFDLRNVKLTAWLGTEKISERFGEMEFAPFGISGPIVMDMSREIIEYPFLESGKIDQGQDVISLTLDLKPALDKETLLSRVMREFEAREGARFNNALRAFVPAHLLPLILHLSDIPHDKPIKYISEEEICEFVNLLKCIKMYPSGTAGFNHAIVTRGGVSLKEIDPATMRSKICRNLWFAGEVIDIDGPTGGFNLQNCWSTGAVAGRNVF
ncbi:MAG: NAD(P)/FAD-dependent oxidoreductase [Synergistaceae bacterium]|nr:NAD(P)/FAD-dependent oxidoreductase [Synergistaceae bacterium]